jgi:hypothetical protein
MEFATDTVSTVRDARVSALKLAQRLQAEADDAADVERMWAECLDYLVKGWPLHLLSLLESEAPRLKRLRKEGHPAIPALEEAYALAKQEPDRIFRRYPALLEEAFRTGHMNLDADSRHPRYYLEHGFLRIEISEPTRTAQLFDNEGRLDTVPADVPAVVEAVKREHQRIFGRPFSGQQVLRDLRRQYVAILKAEGQPDGASLPIRHITRRLGKNVKGFRTDEFLVDLSRLAEQGPFVIDGRRLDLQQTKDTSQGMLLLGASARGYVGFVVFREV